MVTAQFENYAGEQYDYIEGEPEVDPLRSSSTGYQVLGFGIETVTCINTYVPILFVAIALRWC